jgi:subtilisin-like proprotein convertase family protein
LTVAKIPKNRNVYTAYPMIPGVLVVGAMSSRTRKSGYSNWGPHLTVTAPSSNGHELNFRDSDFTASQTGLGQIAASNRPGLGAVSDPLGDDPRTPINEGHYTASFGGTSGAAPVVAGIAALMLSINPTLTAAQVRQILQATADTDLDTRLDLADDPNLQGLTGEFSNGSSRFFGAGKVNAARAVRRAQALPGGIAGGVAAQGSRDGSANPNERIPDDRPEGITSSIDIAGEGPVRAIRVDIDITHSYRGDLRVVLASPQGRVAILHNMTGSFRDDLKQTYTAENNDDLANLVRSGTAGQGRWTLNVSDNLRRDVGTLNAWRLDLREL